MTAQRCWTITVLFGVALVAASGLTWFAIYSPQSRFLPQRSGADWILYPVPAINSAVATREEARGRYERHTTFQRDFDASSVPSVAELRLCSFGDLQATLNGHSIELPPAHRWNDLRLAEVARYLQPGANRLQVVVSNDDGPPVLWLRLQGTDLALASDASWRASMDGATDCAVQLADQPPETRPGNRAWNDQHPIAALESCLPLLVVFAALSAGLVGLVVVANRRLGQPRLFGRPLSPLALALAVSSALWILLFARDTFGVLRTDWGFDAWHHLDYIAYIQKYHALPLADEGWEMHQPPLYYLLSAGLLQVLGLSVSKPQSLLVLRLEGLACGLAELALVAGCLKLLFPGQPKRQVAGMALAAFLPVQIYTCLYIGNEPILTLFVTAAIYVCLRMLRENVPSTRQYVVLGLCLGAALLCKITAVVAAGVILAVLCGRLVVRGQYSLGPWLRGVALTALVMLAVSGWHYGRVWAHFGTPLKGNYEAGSGWHFWEDPGYATPAYLFRFGECLTTPFFSAAFNSLPDGLYASFWGDGFCGGTGTWVSRPPWNYDLMSAGYLLALLPSAAIGLGACAALVVLIRRPQAEWFLLLGIAAGLVVGLLYQWLRFPYNGHGRANYHLLGMTVYCAFAALGLDLLTRLGRATAVLIAISMGAWALTAYSQLWIRPASSATYTWAGQQVQRMRLRQLPLLYQQSNLAADLPGEAYFFREALRADPHSVLAHLNVVRLYVEDGQFDTAQQLLATLPREADGEPDALYLQAMIFSRRADVGPALACLRRVLEAAPDHAPACEMLAGLLVGHQQTKEAIAAYRDALRIWPERSAADRAALSVLLARAGEVDEAVNQCRKASRLRPDQPIWLADLAWTLATDNSRRLHTASTARSLAEEANRRTNYQDPLFLEALAAAQAADGQYEQAAATIARAKDLAQSSGPSPLKQRLQEELNCYQNKNPFLTSASLRSVLDKARPKS